MISYFEFPTLLRDGLAKLIHRYARHVAGRPPLYRVGETIHCLLPLKIRGGYNWQTHDLLQRTYETVLCQYSSQKQKDHSKPSSWRPLGAINKQAIWPPNKKGP